MYFTFKPRFAALAVAAASALPAALATPDRLDWDGFDLAAGAGVKGPWQQNNSRYDYVDDATVAFGTRGKLYAAWVDQKSKDVFLRKVAPDREAAARNVSRSPATFSWHPRIAVAPDQPDRLYLLWQEIIFSGGSHGGDILFARSDDGGATFSVPVNLSQSPGGDGKGRLDRKTWSNGSLDLAVAGDGTVYAAWTEYDGALWFSRSLDGGIHFTRPRQVAGDDRRPARAPSLAAGPGSAVHLAWTVGEDPDADIHIVQSGDGGASFGPAHVLADGPGHADAPRLALDGRGALHLVYAHAVSGPGGRYAIRHTRSPGPADRFDAPRVLSGTAENADGAGYPAIATDGLNRLVVTWEVMPGTDGRSHALGITCSADAGRHFARPARVPGSGSPAGGSNGSHQGLLGKKLAMDRSGKIVLANSSLLPGKQSRVWLMRATWPSRQP